MRFVGSLALMALVGCHGSVAIDRDTEPGPTAPDAARPGDAATMAPPVPWADGGGVDLVDAGPGARPPDAGPRPEGVPPGGACDCDLECLGTAAHPGVCVDGVCMARASGECAESGSRGECPDGMRCWGVRDHGGAPVCWPDCEAFACAGTCDADGSCAPDASSSCDGSCAALCDDPGPSPLGAPPACAVGAASIPDWRCDGGCDDLLPFEPRTGPGYEDYPINGETASDPYRSYLRRDAQLLIRYAAAMVACQSAGWTFGNGGPIGLGDMSEGDGSIPGTREGDPAHPSGSHLDGRDIDIGYFQTGGTDNRLRPVCEHTSGGSDAYHCTAAPDRLDVWRTALFLGHLHASPRLRIIGVDGRIGPLVEDALETLCAEGWLDNDACSSPSLAYETTDRGAGWYRFHHHHFHMSMQR